MPTSDAVFAAARRHMVACQLLPNQITDARVVAAMGAVPRERFVPPTYRGVAYVDEDIAVVPGRYLMEPMVLAKLLQATEIQPTDVILDVGCATGYSAAVLARLGNTVVGLECMSDLARQATENLAGLGIDNAAVVEGELPKGLPGQGPFDVILFQGAVEVMPDAILGQLAPAGRLVAVVRERGVGRATLWRRLGDGIARRTLFDAAVPLLPGFARAPQFVF